MENLPPELEYVGDYVAQENFKVSFRRQVERCLILMITDPDGSFELSLAGIDVLLDYYKDSRYVDDMDEMTYKHKETLFRLAELKKKNSKEPGTLRMVAQRAGTLQFMYNVNRFKALMKLAGRSSFLPYQPITMIAGGPNPDFENGNIDVTEDLSLIDNVVGENLLEKQELIDKDIAEMANKTLPDGLDKILDDEHADKLEKLPPAEGEEDLKTDDSAV